MVKGFYNLRGSPLEEPLEEHNFEMQPTALEGEHPGESVEARSTTRIILKEIIETVLLALLMFGAINLVSARIQVKGRSMEPNFHDREYVIVNKLAYRFGEFERGDVIVFPYPLNEREDYIKRVIGLPGDTVAIRGGQVYVNNQVLVEEYIKEAPRRDMQEMTVPAGTVFVMGDNRNDSSDSRTWGPLDMEAVIGKAVFVYWPISEFGVVENPEVVFAAPQQ